MIREEFCSHLRVEESITGSIQLHVEPRPSQLKKKKTAKGFVFSHRTLIEDSL